MLKKSHTTEKMATASTASLMKLCQVVKRATGVGQLPPEISKTCLVFGTTTKYNHFAPPKNQLVAPLQIVKVEVCVREVRQVISKLLNLTKKEAGASDETCED